ncbi:hypothetical protein [Salinimicrobium soli]|uniref:hypothetical protein n=1 Tax=Salinimicrobium soli TaxID=1254399 RepID=UPI003AAC173C
MTNKKRRTYRIFYSLEEHLEVPMFLLALLWLYLFIKELVSGLSSFEENLIYIVWVLFILEFVVKLVVAPRKMEFLKDNWITIIALLVPALRVFRLFRAVSLLNSVRVVNSTKIIRAVTSGKRFFSALQEAQGPAPKPEIDVGILIAYSKPENREALKAFVQQLQQDVCPHLEASTNIPWNFDITDEVRLESDVTMRPSDFLDSASQRMAEGPYDLVTVITDVGLMSRKHILVPGLSSSVSRTLVISTRKLTTTGRRQANLELTDPKVRFNSSALFLNLTGQIFGLPEKSGAKKGIMGIKNFDADLKAMPEYSSPEKERLRKKAPSLPDRELREGTWLESFIFHLLMTLRHPKQLFVPLFRNRALFLPLSLPGLATAAVAPAFILIFTAEIWDVGLGMTNFTAILFAVISVLLASFYLVSIQSLFLPRKEKRILTEHLAVANSVIYCSIFLACVGLFLLVGFLMLILEFYVFPADLMQTWPTLETGTIGLTEKIRLAVFISTVGVTTGALAGGLDNRAVIQHLALFRDRP